MKKDESKQLGERQELDGQPLHDKRIKSLDIVPVEQKKWGKYNMYYNDIIPNEKVTIKFDFENNSGNEFQFMTLDQPTTQDWRERYPILDLTEGGRFVYEFVPDKTRIRLFFQRADGNKNIASGTLKNFSINQENNAKYKPSIMQAGIFGKKGLLLLGLIVVGVLAYKRYKK